MTEGSLVNYIELYSLQFSKDRKSWKTYKDAVSKERKVVVPPFMHLWIYEDYGSNPQIPAKENVQTQLSNT